MSRDFFSNDADADRTAGPIENDISAFAFSDTDEGDLSSGDGIDVEEGDSKTGNETPENPDEVDGDEDDGETAEGDDAPEDDESDGSENKQANGQTPAWIKEARAAKKQLDRENGEWGEDYIPLKAKAPALVKAVIDGTSQEMLTTLAKFAGSSRIREMRSEILAESAVEFIANELSLTPDVLNIRLMPPKATEIKLSEEFTNTLAAFPPELREEFEKILSQAKRTPQIEAELHAFQKNRAGEINEMTKRESDRVTNHIKRDFNGWMDITIKDVIGATKEKQADYVGKVAFESMTVDPAARALMERYFRQIRDEDDPEMLEVTAERIIRNARKHIEQIVRELEIPVRDGYVLGVAPDKPQTKTPKKSSAQATNIPAKSNGKNAKDQNPWLLPRTPETMAARRRAVAERKRRMGIA